VWRINAINTTVPLDYTHRVPGEVIIDEVPRFLKIDSLAKHIGRNKNIKLVRRIRRCIT
jgi:hypothetical protein